MAEDFQEKTEEATPKKMLDARKKGRVARSNDFTAAFLMFIGIGALFFFSALSFGLLRDMTIGVFRSLGEISDTFGSMVYWARQGVVAVLLLLSPVLVGVFLGAFFGNVLQIGILFSMDPLTPKWKSVNLFDPSNYKKFFSISAVMRLCFGLGKLIVIACITYLLLIWKLPSISQLINAPVMVIFFFLFEHAFYLSMAIVIFLFLLGIGDLVFQQRKFAKDQKMTKQEVKDERKQTEGDSQIKGKMRSLMQGMMQSRMKDQVPHADVVIANPVHYAIAIKYDAETMGAPVCVAKGARKIAVSIKEIAKEHNVPIVENPPLARALYRAVDVGAYVPPDFYHSIAEVLAYVYRMNETLDQMTQ